MKKFLSIVLVSALLTVSAVSCGQREEIVEDTVSVESFETLSLDATSADVIIKQGKENQVHYRVPESLTPDIKSSGKKLDIISKSDKKFQIGNVTGDEKIFIELTLTEKMLNDIKIDVTSGDIDISDTGISGSIETTSGDISIKGSENSGNLKIDSTSGDLKLKDISAGDIVMELTSGETELKNMDIKDLSVKSTSGSVNVSGTKTDNIDIHCTSGDIDLDIIGEEKDYNYELSASSGDITLPGTSASKHYSSDQKAKKDMNAKTTSGDISVSFS